MGHEHTTAIEFRVEPGWTPCPFELGLSANRQPRHHLTEEIMSENLKRRLPVAAAISVLAALIGFIVVSQTHRRVSFDSGETRRTVDAAVAELQAMRPSSLDDPPFQQALEKLRRARYVAAVWLIRPDGQIAFSNARFADRGRVEEWATEETHRVLSEMPEGFLTPLQRTALLAASAVQSEGEHNDVFRQMVRPLRASDDTELGIVALSYDVNPGLGGFPGFGYAVAVLVIPVGLMVYWLALVGWVFLDAKVRGERAWVWAMFVLMGNLVALFAYLLARQPHPGCRQGSVPNSSLK
jgi:hypothetical protein